MRQATVTVLMAVLVVSAGCSSIGLGGDDGAGSGATTVTGGSAADGGGGGGGGDGSDGSDGGSTEAGMTPTPTATPSPTATPGSGSTSDAGLPPGVRGSKMVNHSKFTTAFFQQVSEGPVEFRLDAVNRTAGDQGSFEYVVRNDTEQQLYSVNKQDIGVTTYYVTSGADGVRNTTTGETRYGQDDSRIEFEASFTLFFAFLPAQFITSMEWQVTGTESVDGEQYTVLESDSLNRTAANQFQFGLGEDTENISSIEGRLLVDSEGLVRQGTINASGTSAAGARGNFDMAIEMSDSDVAVEQPSWFDESDAQSSGSESSG